MPKSKLAALPQDIRQAFNQRLVEQGFQDYAGLSDWLAGQGYEISKSSVHRYGSKFEARLEKLRLASEQARGFVDAAPDDEGAMADAAIRMVQERIFDVMLAAEDGDLKELSRAARAIAETARAGTAVRQERRKLLKEAANAAGKAARANGLSEDTATMIRHAIEGVK